MRTAVLFDVHGNLAALDAVLAEVDAEGVDAYAVGGDLALFGPEPAACVDRLRALPGALFVQGNTDRYLGDLREEEHVQFFAGLLGEERLAWLRELPTRFELSAHDALVVHATPRGDEEQLRPETPDDAVATMLEGEAAHLIVGGHVHLQFLRPVGARVWLNPGSVGLPFDGDQRAAWAILHEGGIDLRRTAYDVDGVVAAVEASGSPVAETVARRLREAAP